MQRKEFLKQTGMILGALPTLGAASLPVVSQSKIPTNYDPMNWSEVRDQFALRRSQIHMSTFLLSSHPRPVAVIKEAPFLNEKQKRDIFYNNAARFLRLSDEEIARHHGR